MNIDNHSNDQPVEDPDNAHESPGILNHCEEDSHSTSDVPKTSASEPKDEPSDDDSSIPDVQTPSTEATKKTRRKRRKAKLDAVEQRLAGRRALCKRIPDIAPNMLKMVKLRVLGRYLESIRSSTRGMAEADLTERIVNDSKKLAEKQRILTGMQCIEPDVDRRILKEIILYVVLLQEETHSLEENRLSEKVIEFEKDVVNRAKQLDFFDEKKHDPMRSHHYDTYRIVLEAAWRNDDDISREEASLLYVLRDRLSISLEEHRLIGAYIKRFPKAKCALHTPDDVHDARKELQKDGLLYSYRDENNNNIDTLPYEIATVIRKHITGLELQQTNYRRILQHDCIRVPDIRSFLATKGMDRTGNKPELIERIVHSDIVPSEFLDSLDRTKLAEMSRLVGLKSSSKKAELIHELIEFYDDLTVEERETQDDREEWYNNYELLASRSYADLRAKKLIGKDLDVEHQFEKATDFLFEVMLGLEIDASRKTTKVDGRIMLENGECILWDCKSVEKLVNLQDHLEDQFDLYMRREREKGSKPLGFFVIGPGFTTHSIKLAYQYKARTNWDIALICADALKHLADQWYALEEKKSFPIRLLNQTELIDKDRVEFLLSLA
jgi:hypothetical protein